MTAARPAPPRPARNCPACAGMAARVAELEAEHDRTAAAIRQALADADAMVAATAAENIELRALVDILLGAVSRLSVGRCTTPVDPAKGKG